MVLVLHPQQVKCWSTISTLFALYLTYLLLMKLVYNIGPSGQLCTSGLFSSVVSAQDKAADPSRNVSGEQPMSIFLEIILFRKTNRLVYTWPSAHQSFVTSSSPLVRSRFNTLSAKGDKLLQPTVTGRQWHQKQNSHYKQEVFQKARAVIKKKSESLFSLSIFPSEENLQTDTHTYVHTTFSNPICSVQKHEVTTLNNCITKTGRWNKI